MIQRILFLAAAAAAAALAGVFCMRIVHNPMDGKRVVLAEDLRSIDPNFDMALRRSGVPPDRLAQSIVDQRRVWGALVERPAPPPQPFDINGALQGVSASRHGIGEKARIMTPDNPRGDYYGVGDSIRGVTITEITRDSVVFKKIHEGKEYTKRIAR